MMEALQMVKDERTHHKIPMSRFYAHAGVSRQGFFQGDRREKMKRLQWAEIETLVVDYRRKKDRRAGSRSLFHNLKIKEKFGMGINKFERLMSGNGMCLATLRTRIVTTTSSMQSWNYSNLTHGMLIDDINQVVVGDITYVYINAKRFFLFCLTDIYSSKVVGHHLSLNMTALDAKKALDMWVRSRAQASLVGCIHHTDGGTQYFSKLYLSSLGLLNVKVSRAENCLENGYAEQRNGLIKHHLLPTISTENMSISSLQRNVNQVITRYNRERKQERLGWLSPEAFEKKIPTTVHGRKIKIHDFTK